MKRSTDRKRGDKTALGGSVSYVFIYKLLFVYIHVHTVCAR